MVTSDKEKITETVSVEEPRKPMNKFWTTTRPVGVNARTILPSVSLCLIALFSCIPDTPISPPGPAPSPHEPGQMTQVSVINALMIGRYDGVMPVPELLKYGDFGLGTLDHLDGEMIVLDGHAYQVRGDGVIREVGSDRSTPFATVTRFEKDGDFPCQQLGKLSELETHLDDAVRAKNNFLSVRVDGQFASIKLRSVHRQKPPYKPLAEVAKSQSEWTHDDVSGTLVGIRCPTWVKGLNVPGYHWHFLSDDRKIGGHVLECQVTEGRVQYDVSCNWQIKLDHSAEFNGVELGADLSRELHRVESSRGEESQDGAPER